MELTLESASGVPANSVLSIMIGETKRQGPISKLGQSFQFSSSLAEPLPMTVEILTPVGSKQTVNFEPTNKTFAVNFEGQMQVTLAQRHVPELGRQVPGVSDACVKAQGSARSPDRLQVARSAAEYLGEHDLVRTFQDILHGLLITKPKDPLAYLEAHVERAKQLKQKSGNDSAAGNGSPSRRESQGLIVRRSKVEALLEILQRTRKNINLIMPMLPDHLRATLKSRELADDCRKQFRDLDKSGAGTLGPQDLISVIVQLSSEKSAAISVDQCKRFIAVFDANEDGKIQLEEFLILTQFVIIAAHLESPEGKRLLEEVRVQEHRFQDFCSMLEKDKNRINDVVPFLPDWVVSQLTSQDFFEECQGRFDALDVDKSGRLEPNELLPVVLSLSGVDKAFLDHSKCTKFVELFDVHRNGVIMRDEFIDFVQFLVVMNFLSQSGEGKEVAQASSDYADKKKFDSYVDMLLKDYKRLPDVCQVMPSALVSGISSAAFEKQCQDRFNDIDTSKKRELEIVRIVPIMQLVCTEYAIDVEVARLKATFNSFSTKKLGYVERDEVAHCIRYVVVVAYLHCCSQWHTSPSKSSDGRRDFVVSYLHERGRRSNDFGHVLFFLPLDLREELASSTLAHQCNMDFATLDKAQAGVLEHKHLVPFVLDLAERLNLRLSLEFISECATWFFVDSEGFMRSAEYLEFSKFMMIMAHFSPVAQTQAPEAPNDNFDGKDGIEELLTMLKKDRKAIRKVIPLLPPEICDELASKEFQATCEESFKRLDRNKNGVLTPDEVVPVVVELSKARPHEVSPEHCVKFIRIFDIHGDGVIREDEFVDCARFLCVMSYLYSEEGKNSVKGGLKLLEDAKLIQEFLQCLKRDWRQFNKLLPYLPDSLQDELMSAEFSNNCLTKFQELDADKNGALDPRELFPMLLEMTSADQCALDMAQCAKFAAIFDGDHNGVISHAELVNFARFLMIGSYLETPEGQKIRQEAVLAYKEEKARSRSRNSSERSLRNDAPSEAPAQTLTSVRSTVNLPTAGAELGHLTLDVEHYKEKSTKLQNENDALRDRLYAVEQQLRMMKLQMEDQERQLSHARIDLKAAQRR